VKEMAKESKTQVTLEGGKGPGGGVDILGKPTNEPYDTYKFNPGDLSAKEGKKK
jgi:hypothetical protein